MMRHAPLQFGTKNECFLSLPRCTGHCTGRMASHQLCGPRLAAAEKIVPKRGWHGISFHFSFRAMQITLKKRRTDVTDMLRGLCSNPKARAARSSFM